VNKPQLLQLIVERLTTDLDTAQRAAQSAYETATHKENIAENKYDTLGLEASYLATGQARRMLEIRQALALYQQLEMRPYQVERGIAVGDLVMLEDLDGKRQRLFLGPEAAGLKLQLDGQPITVITPRSPLGQGLLGKRQGEALHLSVAGVRQEHEVSDIC
jgi:transcription elongation GreA/GreB family factor